MVDGATLAQGMCATDTKLQNMVSKRGIQLILHCSTSCVEQVLSVVSGVPGFQFRKNIDTLYLHYEIVSPRIVLWVAAACGPFTQCANTTVFSPVWNAAPC
jgi:hypothetical protein